MISTKTSPHQTRLSVPLTVDTLQASSSKYRQVNIPKRSTATFSPATPSSVTTDQSSISWTPRSVTSSPTSSAPVSPLTPVIPPRSSSFVAEEFDGPNLPSGPTNVLLRKQDNEKCQRQPSTVVCSPAQSPVNHSPRVRKMLEKHPAVKVDWRVPEPIKAAGETLRGVLIISFKDITSELKNVAVETASGVVGNVNGNSGTKTNKKIKKSHVAPSDESNGMLSPERARSTSSKRQIKLDSRMVKVEHIEIDLTGVEEVTTGSGLLSKTRTDQHCFLRNTLSLPVGELKLIQDSATTTPTPSSTSSSISSSSYSSSSSTSSSSASSALSSSTYCTVPSALLPHQIPLCRNNTISSVAPPAPGLETDGSTKILKFMPGYILPGTRQGIPFSMRVPERVGGSFKSAHASVSYELTAHVHIRLGREVFILKHPLSVSLFELVQIRATKGASPHDMSPVSASTSMAATTAQSVGPSKNGVRFVIPQSNSVLGTASVRPYSLWGLGPATSSQSSQYQYSSSHGYGRYHHQRRGSLNSATTPSSYSATTAAARTQGMVRSHSATNEAMSALHQSPDPQQSQRVRVDSLAPDQPTSSLTSSPPVNKEPSRRRRLEEDKNEQLDEVGFGAHIDKSTAAAGDNVTMDMFVCKSDLMKVVNIKVSLVETIHIYSFVDDKDQELPIQQESRRLQNVDPLVHLDSQTRPMKKRLIDTHVVKVAKAYVPAQAEENHANDNHLKGYYEDYEDFRTTKSLSMYKLGMRIPETALTITDRELVKVDYAFIIKFFFKGRMGAFLELPIEIVSQYNHNRISTISGAISCVSNSVQIAMPPVPILVKKVEGPQPGSSLSTAIVTRAEEESLLATNCAKDAAAIDNSWNSGTTQRSATVLQDTEDESSHDPAKIIRANKIDAAPRPEADTEQLITKDPFMLQVPHSDTQSDDSRLTVLASAKIPVSENADMATCTSPSLAGAEVLTAPEEIFTSPVTETAAKVVVLQEESQVPCIVIDSAKSTSSSQSMAVSKQVPIVGDSSLERHEAGSTTEIAVVTTPVLPLLFDLTSTATPVIPQSATLEYYQHSALLGSDVDGPQKSIFAGATKGFHCKDGDSTLIGGYLGVSPAQGHSTGGGGLVAKIAKSITSSPLLRSSRSGSVGNGSSPSGSSSNLFVANTSGSGSNGSSPQNPHSTTFTLAVTTLSALTLLSSVSQAAVVGNSETGGDENRIHRGGGGSSSNLAHGGGGGKTVARLHKKGLDKLSAEQKRQEPRRRLSTGPTRALKSCLKKPTVETKQHPRTYQQPQQLDILPRKKVTFAKGSTPSPSPTGSLIFIQPHRPQLKSLPHQFHQSEPPHQPEPSAPAPTLTTLVGTGTVLSAVARANQPTRTVPRPVQVTTSRVPEATQTKQPSPTKSPGTFSPRPISRGSPHLHHPFDSHPSRLSPLEKQTLENQELIVPAPFEAEEEGEEEEEEEEGEETNGTEEDEDMAIEDDDGDDDDDDEDERESEEERVERRRVARVAWLAKYGDAFKQVYGAVPELPPI